MERLDAVRIDVPGVEVRVLERCDSTNSILLSSSGGPALVAAEAQSAGRGQRGRRWESAPGDLTFSLACRVARPVRELTALPLVAGVATAKALRALGVTGVTLKWPNDLVVAGAKLGGILVETRAEAPATRAVFGIGINCFRRPALARRLRRPVAAIEEFVVPSRNLAIAGIARALLEALERFEAEGFGPAREEWEAMDAHAGQRLRVQLADGRSISGIGGGLAADGALRIITRRGEHAVRSGRIVAARLA